MIVKYTNETKNSVNIRGLVIAPGTSRDSQVFIKNFDEAVEKEELSLIIDDGYRQIKVKPVNAKETAEETADPAKPETGSKGGDVSPPVPPVEPPTPQLPPVETGEGEEGEKGDGEESAVTEETAETGSTETAETEPSIETGEE